MVQALQTQHCDGNRFFLTLDVPIANHLVLNIFWHSSQVSNVQNGTIPGSFPPLEGQQGTHYTRRASRAWAFERATLRPEAAREGTGGRLARR